MDPKALSFISHTIYTNTTDGDFFRQGLDKLTPEQQEEVHRVCDIIPDVEVNVDIFVEDEKEIAENDLTTIKVRTGRANFFVYTIFEDDFCTVKAFSASDFPCWHDLCFSRHFFLSKCT